MDDFVISNLQESRNEWCSRLITIFTPLVTEGIRSIFNEAWKLCLDNDEVNKYLMTFQNLLSRVPKWNNEIVEEERRRIVERSGCNYLEDLITCVHIIQLKVLTCIRVGNKQKKIDISIPKLDSFVHKVYINVARKVYKNVYLFEKNISPLLAQRNHRELELMVQECILAAIRDSIPTEEIIRAYMDESVEQEEEVIIENIAVDEPTEPTEKGSDKDGSGSGGSATAAEESDAAPPMVPAIQNIDNDDVITRLTFSDPISEEKVIEKEGVRSLEEIERASTSRFMQRQLDEEESDDERIKISGDTIDLSGFDVLDEEPKVNSSSHGFVLDDVEELF